MIVVSLLLIGVAVILLVSGLVQPSSALLSASIGTSLLAAVVLLVGARQSAMARLAPDGPEERAATGHRAAGRHATEGHATEGHAGSRFAREALAGDRPAGDPEVEADGRTINLDLLGSAIPQQASPEGAEVLAGSAAGGDPGAADHDGATAEDENPPDEDPPDEPAAQQVSAADAARVSRMATEVLVVDGRPRYHLAGCVHLLGRESEPLPVSEAIELGFTPCSLCEPDSALLADARRV